MKRLFSIQKVFLFLFFFLFVSTNISFAEEDVISIKGKEAAPFFDCKGNLNILYATPYGEIKLLTAEKAQTLITGLKQSYKGEDIGSIYTKKDLLGNRWVVWEERERERSDIFLAQILNNTIFNQTCLTASDRGFNFSPAVTFSSANELFLAWVNYFEGENRIVVENFSTAQRWLIDSYSGLDPQLLTDAAGNIWLFWVGQLRHHDEILYTVYENGIWKEAASLNKYPHVPHLTPSAVSDDFGFIHVVWSAYDGEDYDLYYSYWNGNEWSYEQKITHNHNISDGFPCISLYKRDIPVVAWMRNSRGGQEVWMAGKRGEEWSPEVKISGDDDGAGPPKIVASEKDIYVLWQSEDQIKAVAADFSKFRSYYRYGPQELRYRQGRGTDSVFNILELNNNKHIAFGDSITYGVINYKAAPDKGYVPRLESLLRNNINPNAVVLNRGKGGEYTSGGLSRINSVITSDQAKTIYLMEGTNDAKDTSVSIESAAYNLEQMANICVNYNMKTFLSTIIPRLNWGGMIKDRIYALNSRISSIASNPSIHFVDNFNAFYNYPGGWTNLFSDVTHPNETGYQVMAETWYKAYVQTLPPTIELNNNYFYFEGNYDQTEIPPQAFRIRNSRGGKLSYEISSDKEWIGVSPSSGESTGEWDQIEVSVDISGLSYGELYEGEITITSRNATNSPQKVKAELYIIPPPTIELDKDFLYFKGKYDQTEIPPKAFRVRNSGGGKLAYEISSDKEWLSVSPSSGESSGEWDGIKAAVDISDLSYGVLYEGEITITSGEATNSPQKVNIELYIEPPPLYPPSNFQGQKKENRSLSLIEYINVLTWEANTRNEVEIEKYKIYLIENGENILIAEVNPSTFEYLIRKMDKDKVYKYGITALDIYERESEFAYTEIK